MGESHVDAGYIGLANLPRGWHQRIFGDGKLPRSSTGAWRYKDGRWEECEPPPLKTHISEDGLGNESLQLGRQFATREEKREYLKRKKLKEISIGEHKEKLADEPRRKAAGFQKRKEKLKKEVLSDLREKKKIKLR